MIIESYKDPSLKIFSLNSNKPLAEKIANVVGTQLGKSSVKQFSDGEIQINIEESIRGDHVYVIQSTNYPVNDHLLELLIMIDALKRASAKTINIVMPYYGYGRQDRTAKPREPITAKLVANLVQKAGATRMLMLDLHTVQLQGFFDIPVDNLFTMPLFAKHYQECGLSGEEVVVVSPKNSGVGRARVLSEYLDATLAIVDQPTDEQEEAIGSVIGNIQGKTCIMVDDMINTGETLARAATILMENGAKAVYACASHGLFSNGATTILKEAPIQKICVTDSIDFAGKEQLANLEIITSAELIGKGIKGIHENKPLSPLFKL
ncbi:MULTISPECIES: ribose-phosphate diphosphokinase [Carnobacterium]|uniref:ribose-phosphate diphosphokinase n=1 Tax=Carnobacterium TaxID=2747 RepID=UPI0007F3EC57|nr:ribose-phosphate diphosphokinase [Carnobacterium divergens]MDT1941935.1 ribose-phosphate diphosphokinase [Carnobacterium divergens]MDT1947733.1 ribose-phosphate diphosphokinase [Carnobacterium divergens]MDT1950221.1 ribose-phosphate diphosphokinase [Carnobacterium divergens]MDT1955399.1 ribose-phosphate diphosphokinase [Carnobacterium divergens]